MKKITSILLCVCLAFSMAVPAFAVTTPQEDPGIDFERATTVYSDDSYGGFAIDWENFNGTDLIVSAADEFDTINYDYNADGERVSKTVNGVETQFFYDEFGNLVKETQGRNRSRIHLHRK